LAVNTRLPRDISVTDAVDAPEDFNAILSCLKKEYTYKIYNSRIKDPFYADRAYFYPQRMDLERMRRAAAQFCGDPRLQGGALRRDGDEDHRADRVLVCGGGKRPHH
jgi:tRNA pseudouridine(38-40) synthase